MRFLFWLIGMFKLCFLIWFFRLDLLKDFGKKVKGFWVIMDFWVLCVSCLILVGEEVYLFGDGNFDV